MRSIGLGQYVNFEGLAARHVGLPARVRQGAAGREVINFGESFHKAPHRERP